MLIRLFRDQRGASVVEYGLILCLIALGCLLGFLTLGLSLTGIFDTITRALNI